MPESVGYRCKQCGDGFVLQLLTQSEIEELRRKNQRGSQPQCPTSGSFNVERV